MMNFYLEWKTAELSLKGAVIFVYLTSAPKKINPIKYKRAVFSASKSIYLFCVWFKCYVFAR